MSELEILVISRCVERILVVALCGLSLTYGWNLFRLGIVNDQQAEASWRDWKVGLKRVGPGVFFALFGAIGLVYALSRPLTFPSDIQSNLFQQSHNEDIKPSATGGKVSYDADISDSGVQKEVAAINTITVLWNLDIGRNANESDKEAASKALTTLEHRKEILMGSIYQDQYRNYKDLMSREMATPGILNSLNPNQLAQFKHIDEIYNASFINSQQKPTGRGPQ